MRRKDEIRISEKHGVNPSMGTCFWCGQDDGTIILFGKLPGDKEAPRHAIVSYEPCKKCEANFALGILLFEAREEPLLAGQMPIHEGMYPTGRYFVVRPNMIERAFGPSGLAEKILRDRRAAMMSDAFEMLFHGYLGEIH